MFNTEERQAEKKRWGSIRRLGGLLIVAALLMGIRVGAQSVRGGGPPAVTVAQVSDLGASGGQRRFSAQWTTAKPPLTTILKYAVTLEVRFSGGLTQTASQKLAASATSATFALPGVPANAQAVEFKINVSTTFTTPQSGSVTTTREFALTSGAAQGGVGSGGALPPDKPVVQIASASTIDLSRFEIRWNVQAAQGINIDRFGVSGLVTYEFRQAGAATETRQTPVSIALGASRQGSVVVDGAPQRGGPVATRIKVTIATGFNAPVEGTVQTSKDGKF